MFRKRKMNEQILKDAALRPQFFNWFGKVTDDELHSWLRVAGLRVPADLQSLWLSVGGGDIFESETILSPAGEEEFGDNITFQNRLFRSRGLPNDYLVFHIGSSVSAVRLSDQIYVRLNPETFAPEQEFATLNDWYQQVLRSEYRQRYGLS